MKLCRAYSDTSGHAIAGRRYPSGRIFWYAVRRRCTCATGGPPGAFFTEAEIKELRHYVRAEHGIGMAVELVDGPLDATDFVPMRAGAKVWRLSAETDYPLAFDVVGVIDPAGRDRDLRH